MMFEHKSIWACIERRPSDVQTARRKLMFGLSRLTQSMANLVDTIVAPLDVLVNLRINREGFG